MRAAIFTVSLWISSVLSAKIFISFSFCPFSIIFIKWYHLHFFHPPDKASGLAPSLSQCIWPKENGHHHLTEQRILEPHSTWHYPPLLEFLWTIPLCLIRLCLSVTTQRPSFLSHPLSLKLSSSASDVFWSKPISYATPPHSQTLYLDFSGFLELLFSD